MRAMNRMIAFLVILLPGAAIADEANEACERAAIPEAVRQATRELSPGEMQNAEVKVVSVEPAGVSVYGHYSIIQYLVTVQLNGETSVVYSVRTKLSGVSDLCEVQKTSTYRKRTDP